MIGSFWNLCRACPSMPVDKLHSEYRSTYRWHEYRGGSNVVRQPPVPAPDALPPATAPMEPAMPRRKKYPGVAYKANEFFDSSLANGRDVDRKADRARPAARADGGAGRRSQSEGPRPLRPSRWADTVETKGVPASIGDALAPAKDTVEAAGVSTEYRKQFAWPKDGETPRKSSSMGALKAAAAQARKAAQDERDATHETEPLMNHVDEVVPKNEAALKHETAPKRYIEDYLWNGQKPGVHRKTTFRSAISAFISNGDDRAAKTDKENRKRYKSEYKNKFRPFSQYVYEASKGTFTKCRRLKAKAASVERDEADGATEKMLPKQSQVPGEGHALPSLGLANGDSWYREVLDLRKQAGEYKYRGWGTELAPEHINELYNKQMELWYQVSRRSSLSALSLASTNHRALPNTESNKDTEKTPKSPKKLKSFLSGPHQSIHAKLLETRQQERTSQKTSPQKKKKLQGHSFDDGSVIPEGKAHFGAGSVLRNSSVRSSPRKTLNLVIGARDESHVAAAAAKAGFKSPKRRPRSADPVKPIAAVDERPRPVKPTGLALNSKGNASRTRRKQSFAKTPSPSTVIANSMAKRRSRSVCKAVRLIDDETVPTQPRSASVAKDHVFDDSPIVKSPPEPTRVKSPEQMNMRSPDPVNWTVPLDTGKTFTVTQNVKHDENMKRPNSDFRCNSLAEEVETSEIAPVHHQMSPIRTLKNKSSPSKHLDSDDSQSNLSSRASMTAKTPTSPNLTPIDETKTLELPSKIVNGSGSHSSSDTHSSPVTAELRAPVRLDDPSFEINSLLEATKNRENFKPTEATQKSHGGVDTSVVQEPNTASIAAEVLDRARNRFDKFWGKKDENV